MAVLTIPALIDNYQKHVVPIRLKKMYNTLWNAIELAEIENGPSDNWTFESDAEALNFYNTKIRSKMNCVAYNPKINSISEEKACFLADGSLIKVDNARSYGLFSFKFYPFTTKKALTYTYEGLSPSKRYVFFYGLRLARSGNLKAKTEILMMNEDVKLLTRDRILNGPGPSVDPGAYCNGGYKGCFYVIKIDGWKIAPDYPW